MASSISSSLHITPTALLLHTQPHKPAFSHHLSLSSRSSQSQFHGVKLSLSSDPSIFSPPAKPTILAKVTEGTIPPAFSLRDQNGKTVSLSKFKGKPVVVYFYPADETPGCTKQACAFRDSYEKFKKAGAEVVGISGDGSASHKAFAEKYKLPYTLLSDEGNKVRKDWGSHRTFLVHCPEGRLTFLTRMEFVALSTIISSNPKSILTRP